MKDEVKMAKTKIAVKTRIKSVTEKTTDKGEHTDLKFTSLDFTPEQVEKLKALALEKDDVTLTIETVQENLPGI
jgi:hypothetical protein